MKMNHPLKAGLGNIRNPSVLQMLPQKHAKARRRHRALLIIFRQINQRQGRPRRYEEALLSSRSCFYGKQQLVVFRLGDFVNPPSG